MSTHRALGARCPVVLWGPASRSLWQELPPALGPGASSCEEVTERSTPGLLPGRWGPAVMGSRGVLLHLGQGFYAHLVFGFVQGEWFSRVLSVFTAKSFF